MPRPLKERAHPLGVAAGQVVVDRDDVHALAFERVEVGGQGGDQRLALAGDHLGDVAAVEDHPAHELDVEVPHVEEPPARLAAGGERLGQQVVERSRPRPGGGGTRPSWPSARSSESACIGGSSSLILRDDRPHRADPPLVRAAEEPDQPLGDPLREGRERVGRLIPKLGQHFHCRVLPHAMTGRMH